MKNQHNYEYTKNNVRNLYKKNKAYQLIIESRKNFSHKEKEDFKNNN